MTTLRIHRLGLNRLIPRWLAFRTRDALDNVLAHPKDFRIDNWPFIILSAVNKPLDNGDDENNSKSDDGVVHVRPCHRLLRREHKEDGR